MCVGLAARFSGVLLIVLHVAQRPGPTFIRDGRRGRAGKFSAWRLVHLPRQAALMLGGLAFVWMLAMTEADATTILLPPGLPNFAKPLLDAMHFGRQEQPIAACLVLLGTYIAIAAVVVLFTFVFHRPRPSPAGAGDDYRQP